MGELSFVRRAVVTGAGGFLGSALTNRLVECGIEVVAVSSRFDSAFPNDSLIERIEGEIGTSDELVSAVPSGPYGMFYHLAWHGVNGAEKADSLVQLENVRTALNCAAAAKELECEKFLCAGSVAERAVESISGAGTVGGGMVYGAAKCCARMMLEVYCKRVGLNFVWMQFSNVYGPGNVTGNLVSYALGELLEGREALFGPAEQPYDFIFVDDLVEAAYRLGTMPTNRASYFLGSGEPRILRDYLLEIGDACGRRDLVQIGARPDDGVIYSMDMFDVSPLVEDVGNYQETPFGEGIVRTICSLKGERNPCLVFNSKS